jgi:hypothetical protein
MLGVPPTSAQATALSIYQILAAVLQEPRHITKLATSLPLHKILVIILSSNPFPQTVSTTFTIVKAGIDNGASEQFEKSFIAEVRVFRSPCLATHAHDGSFRVAMIC